MIFENHRTVFYLKHHYLQSNVMITPLPPMKHLWKKLIRGVSAAAAAAAAAATTTTRIKRRCRRCAPCIPRSSRAVYIYSGEVNSTDHANSESINRTFHDFRPN